MEPRKEKLGGCDRPGKPTFALTLEALPSWDGPPAIIRLRKFLKAALRSYGLKCIECREAERHDAPQDNSTAGKVARLLGTVPGIDTAASMTAPAAAADPSDHTKPHRIGGN